MQKLWIQIRSSLWFVPTLLVLAGGVGALVLVQLDVVYANVLRAQSWQPLLNAGAEGSRGMLTAIAGSMITVAGVAFSITIVTLSLASTQYTPRILRNFMRDRANQFVLGTFVAIFTYCLIVLRTIRGGAERDGGGFVPLMAVAFGMLLALLSVGCLIFFIHHVATSIQASYILHAITAETTQAIERLFPEELQQNGDDERSADVARTANWHPVAAHTSGYIQGVDDSELLSVAKDERCALRLERIPGDFVVEGGPFVSVDRLPDDTLADKLRGFFVVGNFRTVEHDAGFGIRQIVDIAMKALSPGVNDTSTAVSCLDYLSVLLCGMANRSLVPRFLVVNDTFRVTADVRVFADYAAKAFDEIRLSADGNVTIILQMLCALQRVVLVTRSTSRQRTLLEQARVIIQSADASVPAPYDRQRINTAIDALRSACSPKINADLSTLALSREVKPSANVRSVEAPGSAGAARVAPVLVGQEPAEDRMS